MTRVVGRALSRSTLARGCLWPLFSTMAKISYAGYRFPPEIIQQTIWLYLRFTLSSATSRICWRSAALLSPTRRSGDG